MLRSLLYSVLRGLFNAGLSVNTAAIRHICGGRWLSANVDGPWTCAELKDMLTRLSTLPDIKTFLLIDALDECEPQDSLYDLAIEVLRISHLANVKICVSCRPWKVFTDIFACCQTLRLDQLTWCDMETYVRSRLLVAEAEGDLQTEFRDGILPAKKFIWRVVDAADGVLLWTKLVTGELCSELRKGRSIDTLDRILSRAPTNLDDYFHKLIFDRIGKSQQTVMDTAAALRLAMEIHIVEENAFYARRYVWDAFPLPRSFINFWLLSNHHLEAGFSWADYEHIAQPSTERMLQQTGRFLEEACHELLALSAHTGNVDFFHRTVFDYLSNNPSLVEDAPNHFGDDDFIAELARIRCICVLRQRHVDCAQLLDTLYSILRADDRIHTIFWGLLCEKLVTSQIREICTCYGLDHLSRVPGLASRLGVRGFDDFIRGELKLMPCLAIHETLHSPIDLGHLVGSALGLHSVVDVQSSLSTLRTILECGGDLNASSCLHLDLSWNCQRSYWEAWLAKSYLQLRQYPRTIDRLEHEDPTCTAFLAVKRKIGDMIEIFLNYGADPCCSICTTEHAHNKRKEPCTGTDLQTLLDLVVSADKIPQLQQLRKFCSSKAQAYILRHNQLRRAARSLLTSKQNLESNLPSARNDPTDYAKLLQTRSLEGMMHLYSSQPRCCLCGREIHERRGPPGLSAWCIDCGSLSSLCLDCSETTCTFLKLEHTFGINDSTPPTESHTSVTIVNGLDYFDGRYYRQEIQDRLDLLETRFPIAQEVSLIEEWYSKDPIEPHLSFKEVSAEIPHEALGHKRSGRRFLASLMSRIKRVST